jgi:hypothetical protein
MPRPASLVCFLLALSVAQGSAAADESPLEEVRALDAELAALEAQPPAGVPVQSIVTVRYYLQLAADLRNRFADAARRFYRKASAMI